MQSKKIKVGELDIHYITGGQGDPLVVIHGGGEGAKAWLQNLEELSKYYAVYVPDLPGFGRSQSMSDSWDISKLVKIIEGFSNNLGLTRLHLVGHSIGGGISFYCI